MGKWEGVKALTVKPFRPYGWLEGDPLNLLR